ncbi:MAG TPA: hypothetical protein VGG19_19580 [Tepidisphaeraceae bacterium]|jgi:hypothetical protein
MPVWVGRLLSLLTAILMLAVFAIAAMPNGHAFLGNHSQWIFQKDYLSGAGFYLSYHPRKYTRMDFEMYLPRTYVPFALLMGIAIIPGIAGIICEDKGWIRKAPVQIKPGFMRCATFIARLVFCLSIWLWFIPSYFSLRASLGQRIKSPPGSGLARFQPSRSWEHLFLHHWYASGE